MPKRRPSTAVRENLSSILIIPKGIVACAHLRPLIRPGKPLSRQHYRRRSSMKLASKTILITGSTDGVGRVVALRLADAGAEVLVHGRDTARGESLLAEM